MNAFNKYEISNKLSTLFFNAAILIFIIGLGFTDTPTPFGWYQQFMPNLNGRQIQDITFVDSLTGYAVTNSNGQYDTAFILKTSNSGDLWTKIFARTAWFTGFNRIKFLNNNTGFVSGVSVSGGPKGLTKTTDSGLTWFDLNIPDPYLTYLDMSIIDENTIWLVSSESLTGGVFFTSNGGASWVQQFSGGTQNPNKIYMYNARIGFMTKTTAGSLNVYRTTNGGVNWNISTPGESFSDISFVDSLTGWRSWASVNGTNDTTMKKTTDGGLTWTKQFLPSGNPIYYSSLMWKFSIINKDTLFGVGVYMLLPNLTFHGLLYKTIDGGTTWGYQIPDTNIHITGYLQIQFINKNIGWAYNTGSNPISGIHTTIGGDTTIYYTGLKKLNNNIPLNYELKQNFPNPFNPVTNIKYILKKNANVILKIFDVSGKLLETLINEKQNAGEYQFTFEANNISSGIYFYSLYINNQLFDTKKMILLK